MANETRLAYLSHREVSGRGVAGAVVLPLGATEPHGWHLPYGTDVFQVEAVARRAAERAASRGANVLALPAVPFGVNTNHLAVPGGLAVSLRPSVWMGLIGEVVESLAAQGVRRVLLLNGHGGNDVKPVLRELHGRCGAFVCGCDWFRAVGDVTRRVMANAGDHADETETSLMLHLHGDLVDMSAAGDGATRAVRFEAVRQGWVQITRPWHLLTADTGAGDPRQASAEKGRQVLEAAVERIGDFLYELATSEADAAFPFVGE